MNPVSVSEVIVFVDQYGREHDALVTAVHGPFSVEERNAKYLEWYEQEKGNPYSWNEEQLKVNLEAPLVVPSLNVVYVSDDESQKDSYGRQIARATSVPPRSAQSAHGYYWRNK